jgi:hypothetical protein
MRIDRLTSEELVGISVPEVAQFGTWDLYHFFFTASPWFNLTLTLLSATLIQYGITHATH